MPTTDSDSLDRDLTNAAELPAVTGKPATSLSDESTASDALSSIDDLAEDVGEIGDIGEVVDLSERYEIQGELGHGGMGRVLKAFDRRLQRTVAIKRLKSEISTSRKALQRFLIEAQSIASLNHFHIVQIYDFGRDADGPFLILEFVEGQTLSDALQVGSVTVETAVKLTSQMCAALAVAHERRVIHRDIKPANMLMTVDGKLKLTDFGLARQDQPGTSLHTQTGVVLGTVDFMSPEQRIDASSVDARSDLWSLGATLYQMLTGRSPKVIRIDDVPKVLRTVVGKSLEDAPNDRYQTAVEFEHALRDVLEDSTAGSLPAGELGEGQCSTCGVINDASGKFCKSCGTTLETVCFGCSESLNVWEKFCTSCGGDQLELLSKQRVNLEAIRDQVDELRRAHEYEQAIAVVNQAHEAVDPRLASEVAWIPEFVAATEAEAQQQTARRTELLAEAKQFAAEFRYADAVRVLSAVPDGLQTAETRELRTECQQAEIEREQLREEIRDAVNSRKLAGLLPKVRRYLELRPDNASAMALRDRLEKRQQKGQGKARVLLERAQASFANFDDETVLKFLSQIPAEYRTDDVFELESTAEERALQAAQSKERIQEFAEAVRGKQELALVDSYLQIRPQDNEAAQVRRQILRRRRILSLVILSSTAAIVLVAVGGSFWFLQNQSQQQSQQQLLTEAAAAKLQSVADSKLSEGEPWALAIAVAGPESTPGNVTYRLIDPVPAGCMIDVASGQLRWTPSETQGSQNFTIGVEAIVNGHPHCTNRMTFSVEVSEVIKAPELAGIDDVVLPELTQLDVGMKVLNEEMPPVPVEFSFATPPPEGCTIDAATGRIQWTPSEEQGPGEYPITVVAQVTGAADIVTERKFRVSVTEVNTPPQFTPIAPTPIAPAQPVTLKISATDSDIPAQTLVYELVESPAGAASSSATQSVTWIGREGVENARFVLRITDGTDEVSAAFQVPVLSTDDSPRARRFAPQMETAAFSPDGLHIALGSDDGQVTIRNTVTEKDVRLIDAHDRSVSRLFFSPNGSQLASIGKKLSARAPKNELKLWNVETGAELSRPAINHHAAAAFSHDATLSQWA